MLRWLMRFSLQATKKPGRLGQACELIVVLISCRR